MQGNYYFKFGTMVGLNQYAWSGIPTTREVAVIPPNNFPVAYLGRNSDGRTPALVQTDFYAAHDFRFGGRKLLRVQLDVINLFDQATSINRWPTYFQQGGINFTEPDFYAGRVNFDQAIQSRLAAGSATLDPRFNMDRDFQDARVIRFGVKFSF
jgi:hypothetical protein